MTSRQMSYYYGQPLVHCYLLHADWLTAYVASQESSQTTKLELWRTAIQASIDAARNAQDHPLSLNEAVPVARPRPPV